MTAGLERLEQLMELYAGHNQVEEVREVGNLRGLPKLIILDIAGNPAAEDVDCRLFTVYHLRRLKVGTLTGFCANTQPVDWQP